MIAKWRMIVAFNDKNMRLSCMTKIERRLSAENSKTELTQPQQKCCSFTRALCVWVPKLRSTTTMEMLRKDCRFLIVLTNLSGREHKKTLRVTHLCYWMNAQKMSPRSRLKIRRDTCWSSSRKTTQKLLVRNVIVRSTNCCSKTRFSARRTFWLPAHLRLISRWSLIIPKSISVP